LRRAFLGDLDFPREARVLEVGCGTGVLTRQLGRWPDVASVVGVDVAGFLLVRARELSADLPNVIYREADARSLPFADESFDAVLFDSTLSHVPDPTAALGEAYRVLVAGGLLAAFDGDYSTTTVALSEHDPLQACVDAMIANSVHDRWVMRRLAARARQCGFVPGELTSYGFAETGDVDYSLTIVDRGADILAASDAISAATAAALKAEARRRVDAGIFFGHIAYAGLVARK
jgi:SAM-dependent methyltransferase